VTDPIECRPLHATLGAEVVGVDLACDLDEATLRAIEGAWRRYSTLLFHDVRMTPAQHVAFRRRLAPLHVMEPPEFNLADHPEVFVVSNVEENGNAPARSYVDRRIRWPNSSRSNDMASRCPTNTTVSLLAALGTMRWAAERPGGSR
jgi:alpha-ketoglutarate-dependent taurine dioxygenase